MSKPARPIREHSNSSALGVRFCRPVWCATGLWLAMTVTDAVAQTQNATSIGPTVEQSVGELIERNEEFDSFGWPAAGRINPLPDVVDSYVQFNRELWNYGIGYWFRV